MRIIIIALLTVFSAVGSFCQETLLPAGKIRQSKGSMERTLQPGQDFPDYPQIGLSERSRDIELPAVVDNSAQPYLRPVFSQQGASCGQSASVSYNFCYEINRLRNLPSDTSINQYPDHFVWNFMNATLPYYGEGVSYFHTFDILYDAGNPTEDIYGPITMDDSYYWMSGYDGYYQAMHNRISGVNSIHVSTPEGLLVLKHWLHNHLDGSNVGGVANFYAGMPYDPPLLPNGTPEAGKHCQIGFEFPSSHALTIVGYNDSIRFDLNSDGQYTNHLDITGDGIVDMKDWEIGGLKYVNSYGTYWADSGFSYMLYRTLALKYGQGGIWNNSVHILHADTVYQPLLTAKATLKHNKRGRIKILAGISSDTARYYPEHTMSFSVFNYQGLDYYMAGNQTPNGKTLEFGLDITSLLSFTKPGSPYRVFLIVEENDPDGTGDGMLLKYSVLNYTEAEPSEFISTDLPITIINNTQTLVSVNVISDTNPIDIQPDGPIVVTSGVTNSTTFSASGGYPPYVWNLKQLYNESEGQANYTFSEGVIQVPSNAHNGYAAVPLPFSFPFYGKLYDTLYMHVNGYLMFERQDMPYFYELYDEFYFRQIRTIAGYLNNEMALYSASDFLSVTSSPEQVDFNWRISDAGKLNYATFTTSVFKDGNIRCLYGPSSAEAGFYPVIGISNGSRNETLKSGRSGNKIREGQIIGYSPSQLPSGITLSENGILTVPPETGTFSDGVILRVTDSQRLMAEKQILVTSGPEIIIRLADSLIKPTPGATCPLIVEIKNHGSQSIGNLNLSLSAASDNALVLGGPVSAIEVPAGQTVLFENIFNLLVHDTLSKPGISRVLALLASGSNSMKKFEEFTVDVPVVAVSPPVFSDGDNFIADPGEEAPLVFSVFNYGGASAGNLTAFLNIDHASAAINGEAIQHVGELEGFSKKTLSYKFKINEATPRGSIITMQLILYRSDVILFEGSFSLPIGQPVILVTDLDNNHNSAVHIAAALKQLNTGYEMSESVNPGILDYQVQFLSLGFRPLNHRLTPFEDSLMIAFINQGSNLYLEGGAFFKQDPVTMLRGRLGVQGMSQAWQNPADTLIGIAGSPAEGIQFDYRGDWKLGENLLALEPALPWFRDKNTNLDFVVALDTGYYRTISSSVEFGGTFMFDGPDRPELMRRYLEFLGYNTNPLTVVFKASSTKICKDATVSFEPVCSGSPTSYQWIFEGGTPSGWDGPFPVIKYETTGTYTASLTVTDGTDNNTFSLTDLITVDNCIGVPEVATQHFKFYPNPANDHIYIEPYTIGNQIREVMIADLQGRVLLQKTVAESDLRIAVSTNRLAPGVYMVIVKGDGWSGSSKLVIY
jgi:hypothetical protein